MKKYFSAIAYLLAALIGLSLITGCTLSRMEEPSDKNRSTRQSERKKNTESVSSEKSLKPAENEDITDAEDGAANEARGEIEAPITEQWSEPENTEIWSEDYTLDENSDESKESGANSVKGDVEKLYGTWFIWIPGGAVNLYDEDTGKYVTHEYYAGADAGKVVINKNGTYSMSHSVWGRDKIITGKWRLSAPNEINGEEVAAVILKNGIGDIDWAVAPSPSGKIRLLYAEKWDDGSNLWIFDSELYQK